MGGSCLEGQYWDALLKKCLFCHLACNRPHVSNRCTGYCESSHCKLLPGHYYDRLLKKCMTCAEVCGQHPAECSPHCQTMPPPVTTEKLPATTSRALNAAPTAVEDSAFLLYSLLALCLVLLFSSLSLALAVFLRGSRAKTSKPEPKKANCSRERVEQPGEEVGLPGGQRGQTAKALLTSLSRPAGREPSDDSSPTETCVCIHCFPDLKALGQGNDRPARAPLSFYQQAVPPKAQIPKGSSLWTEDSLCTSGPWGPAGGSGEMRSKCSLSNLSAVNENWKG